MKLSGVSEGNVIDFDPFTARPNADPTHSLGDTVRLADDRIFKYGKVGVANVSKGKLQIAPAPIANHTNLAVTATPNGSQKVLVTPGATAGALGIYDEGVMAVNAGPGAGQEYLISHNPPIAASTQFELALNDGIGVPLTAASRVTLVHNAYNGVVEAAVQTRRICGVPLTDLPAAGQGWLQTRGITAVLAQGAIAVGSDIVPSATVAGAVAVATGTYATDLATKRIGRTEVVAAVDAEYRPVVLTID